MTRSIKILPAWDRMAEGYGKHGAEVILTLAIPQGVVIGIAMTGWHLAKSFEWEPHVTMQIHEELAPANVHADESEMRDSCDWLDGRPCVCRYQQWSGGPSLVHGSDHVFEAMQKFAIRCFGENT